MRAEPQGTAEVDHALRTKDGLLAWANFVCSNSVRHGHLFPECADRTDIVRLQIHQSWEVAGREKDYSDKV